MTHASVFACLRRSKRERSASPSTSPPLAHRPVSPDIAAQNRRLKHAALHVVAPGVLTEKGATLLKPGGALQKEGLPCDNNGTAKLGKVTRRLKSELKAWAEDGRPGASSPISPAPISSAMMEASPEIVMKFRRTSATPTATTPHPKKRGPAPKSTEERKQKGKMMAQKAKRTSASHDKIISDLREELARERGKFTLLDQTVRQSLKELRAQMQQWKSASATYTGLAGERWKELLKSFKLGTPPAQKYVEDYRREKLRYRTALECFLGHKDNVSFTPPLDSFHDVKEPTKSTGH